MTEQFKPPTSSHGFISQSLGSPRRAINHRNFGVAAGFFIITIDTMKQKPCWIPVLFLCGAMVAFSTSLQGQTTSISNAPEVGQGTSTSTVTAPPPLAPSAEEPGHGHGKGIEKLVRALGLTPQQTASLKPILMQRRAQMMAIRKEQGSREQKMAQMKEMRKSNNQEIRSILTPEQQRRFAEYMARLKERRESQGQS